MKTHRLFLVAVCIALLASCGSKNHRKVAMKLFSDDVHMAIDETFRPVMENEIDVFHAQFPEIEIYPKYCSETDALNLLFRDSVRLILTTRKLSKQERASIISHKLDVRETRIGTDAIALIVNSATKDTLITLDELKAIVTGKITKWEQLQHSKQKGDIQLVFDNPNSSTVRYIKDSICNKEQLSGNLKAQNTNSEVIEYIKKTKGSIGVIGVDWLRNSKDSTHLSFNPDVKVMSVSRFSGSDEDFFLPFEYYIATGEYCLTRGVFIICTDPRVTSTTKNLYFFLRDTPGQLIINKDSQMLPYMPVQIKKVNVTTH